MNKQTAWHMYAAISFAVVLIVIGVPLWWYTTEVYRVALPENRMVQLGSAPLTLKLNIHIASNNTKLSSLLSEEIQKYYRQIGDLLQVSVVTKKSENNWIPKSISEADKAASQIFVNTGDMFLVEWERSPHEVLVTSHRVVYFNSNANSSKLIKVLRQWIFLEDTLRHLASKLNGGSVEKSDRTIRRRVPAAVHYDLMVTAINPDPGKLTVDWNLRKVSMQYLLPFIDSISHISNFTLKSQWLYFVSLGNKPEQVFDRSSKKSNSSQWILSRNELPTLITMFETKLSSHVSNYPSLNLVAYMTHCQQAPLNIVDQNRQPYPGPNAFLSPRWGGIIIVNPPVPACKENIPVVVKPDSHLIMSVFITQLRQLIGIPELIPINGAEVLPLETVRPREWELDSLLRLRSFEQLISARLTLKSLVQLLTEIKNIVINDDVGESIHNSVTKAEESAEHLASGELNLAFEKSRESFLSSETAFTDPSLLALLYFPDDQKYAVYIPLFLPIMIPVIMSLNTIRLWLWPKPVKDDTKSD